MSDSAQSPTERITGWLETNLGGRVVRIARDNQQPTLEAWLSPALEYLPARLRVTQANGDFMDYLATKAFAVTVLPPTR